MSLLSNTTSNVETQPKYSSIELAKDLEEYVEENYNLYKRQKFPDVSLTLGKYFDKFVGKFVHLVTGEPIMSKNIKKKQLMKVLRAIGKQQLEKKAASTVKAAAQQFAKKSPEEVKQSVKLQNKIQSILQTMPGKVKPLVKSSGGPPAKKQNKAYLKNSEAILAKLTKEQKKGKLTNVVATRNSRGKIVGINYDYSSNRNRNFIRVNLTNDMMVVTTRQLVTQIETTSTLVGQPLYTVMINPTQSLGGQREKRFASCFDKYDIMECCFEYNPASATTVSGNMFGGFDFDPTQYYPASSDGLEKLLTKPGSHDCMFYGGGKAGQYIWRMPKYPGKKPTFFIDQTDSSGSGIRFANEAQFLLLNGFGIKTAELGIMGSFWCEMTTKFYDPYIQNIDGTESTFTWDPTVGSLTSWAVSDDQALTIIMKEPSQHNNAGVEYVGDITGLGEAGYYVPPGVWTVDMFFNDTMELASTSLSASKHAGIGISWWNVTKTDWVQMNDEGQNLPEGNAAYHSATSCANLISSDAKITYPAYTTFGWGKFIVPNDGLDYYFTFFNDSQHVNTGDGTVVGDLLTIGFNGEAPTPSSLSFRWHSPSAYDAQFLTSTPNTLLVDRITAIEKKLLKYSDIKLIREEKDGKARKMESTIKVAAVLPDLYDNEDDEEEKPHTPLKQEQKFVRVDPPPVAQIVVRDGKESFLYKEGDGLRKCDPPPGAWVFYSKKRDGAFSPMIWKRVVDGDFIRWVCVLDVTTAPSSLYNDLIESLTDYETEKNYGSGYISRSALDISNNEPLVKRGKSVSLK